MSDLHEAVAQRSLDGARALLKAGRTLDLEGRGWPNGDTALAMLCRSASGELSAREERHALWLLKLGADPMARSENQETPLHLAAMSGSVKVVRALAKRGATISTDEYGETPLFGTLEWNNRGARWVKLWSLLLKLGEDLEHRNSSGDTALMSAVENDGVAAVRFLLEKGADPAAVNPTSGESALQLAIGLDDRQLVRLLERALARAAKAARSKK